MLITQVQKDFSVFCNPARLPEAPFCGFGRWSLDMNGEYAGTSHVRLAPRGTLVEWKNEFQAYKRRGIKEDLEQWLGTGITTALLGWWFHSTNSAWGILPGFFLLPIGSTFVWMTFGLLFLPFWIPFFRLKEARIQNIFLPMLPDDDSFFYFADHGIPAIVSMEKVRLSDLATKWVRFQVHAICFKCGGLWPEPSFECPDQCGGRERVLYWAPPESIAATDKATAVNV